MKKILSLCLAMLFVLALALPAMAEEQVTMTWLHHFLEEPLQIRGLAVHEPGRFFRLPEEIAGEMIPSLIIQPIVENAFQHGVKDLEEGGVVSLRYETEEELFRVIVSDNSGKMDGEKVRELWAHVTDPASPDSSALCNLYRRLKLYGEDGNGLELRCVNGGLTAVLTFRKGGSRLADAADRG